MWSVDLCGDVFERAAYSLHRDAGLTEGRERQRLDQVDEAERPWVGRGRNDDRLRTCYAITDRGSVPTHPVSDRLGRAPDQLRRVGQRVEAEVEPWVVHHVTTAGSGKVPSSVGGYDVTDRQPGKSSMYLGSGL